MKKTSILSLMLALAATLPSCGSTPADGTGVADTTVNLIDKYTAPEEEPQLPENFVIPKGYTYEKDYKYSSEDDNCDGIYIGTTGMVGAAMALSGDKIYYSTGEDMMGYIDIKNGETFAICPDPLCDHTFMGGCKYLGFSEPIVHTEKSHILFVTQGYALGNQIHRNICVVDQENGTVTRVYGSDVEGSEPLNGIFLQFITNNKLYFTGVVVSNETDSEGKVITKSTNRLFTMDIDTYEVEPLNYNYGTGTSATCVSSSDKYMILVDSFIGYVSIMDLNQENEKILVEFDNKNYMVSNCYYDSVTDEFYFSVVSNRVFHGYMDGPEEGHIYKVDSNLNCEIIDMPSDKIIRFTLTRNYIYFFMFDPVPLNIDPPAAEPIIMPDGGKMYRIRRDGSSEYELIFDGGLELIMCALYPTIVIGDHIYFVHEYIYQMLYGKLSGKIFLYRSGYVARVGITDKTVKPILLN